MLDSSGRLIGVKIVLALLAIVSLLSRGMKSVLEIGLTIVSITYGSMVGVFLLGVLTKRANEKGSMIGMAIGLLAMLAVWGYSSIAFTWYVLIGTVITFAVGYTASLLSRPDSSRAAS